MSQTGKQFRFDPALVSAAVAHGITPKVAATWSHTAYRAPRILVPCQLDVLVVRDMAQAWAQCAMAPSPGDTNDPAPTETLMPSPFAALPQSRVRGAYLHWYLPNALTNGTSDADTNSATFPQVPDRWAVFRIATGQNAARCGVRGWIIHCGGPTPQVVDLDNWIEPGNPSDAGEPLTALGSGDLSWAGYFDNVVNRLGFADNTLDADGVSGPLTYVVCGWYADPTADPLGDQHITSTAAFAAKMQELGWQVDQDQLDAVHDQARRYVNAAAGLGLQFSADGISMRDESFDSPDTMWWPRAILLHGAVVGIGWPDSTGDGEVGGPPSAASITVAVGNTMAEAMGTLVARANDAPQQAVIVEALQQGIIRELEQPDGRALLDAALHASSFASLSGGPASIEPLKIAPSGPPPAPPANPPAPAPGVFAGSAPEPSRFFKGNLPVFAHDKLGPFAEQVLAKPSYGEFAISSGTAKTVFAEEALIRGNLADVIGELRLGATAPVFDAGGLFEARRAQPRLYTPKDPILLIQGAKRSFVHDSDVFTENGVVNCRLTSVNELSWTMSANGQRFSVTGGDVLARGVENGSVPLECEAILSETALFHPGSTAIAAANAATAVARAGSTQRSTATFDVAAAQRNIAVEQTAWWALRDPRIDHAPLLAQSGFAGTLPAPFAVSPAAQPWNPRHLDWAVEFVPSPNGVNDWSLDEIDFTLKQGVAVPPPGAGLTFEGRSVVTAGAATALSASIRNAQSQAASIGGTGAVPLLREAFYSELSRTVTGEFANLTLNQHPGGAIGVDASGVDRSLLADLATELDQMDVLSCGLDDLLTKLRGGIAPDGVSVPAGGVTPSPFVALRAGVLYFRRLRLVDGFGQYVDLCGSSATASVHGLVVSDALSIAQPSAAQPDAIGLPPRFTAPTRISFRYMSAASASTDPPGMEADHQTSPVCAFVMPNHLDGSLEFFNANGSSAGNLFSSDDGLVHWEDAPGSVTAAGQNPARALANPFAAELANALIDWGVADCGSGKEAALRAMLRTIDTTLWTVGHFGSVGEEHLALLIGKPVCVMRAMLRLDVADPVTTPDGTVTAVPVELGHLTHWQDGLLGYFVNDDYTVLHVATAAADMARRSGPNQGFLDQINLVPQFYADFASDLASPTATAGDTPVGHSYVDKSGVIHVRPNQTVMLTMLVEPLTSVHATTGLLPCKDIGMRREWVNDGLAKLAPTFRFGPVLVDPQQIRMPLATDLNGAWVWDYRANAVQWKEGNVTNATDNALLAPDPPAAMEGWLRLEPPANSGGNTQ
ncbi:MAG TPA: hypothetical protein VII56_01655 [Rhizomicrobium sp.]